MPAKRKSLGEAMSSSLRSEKSSVEKRFEKADRLFPGGASEKTPTVKPVPVERVIRDNYSMPQSDHEMISGLRERCLKLRMSVTKSEILRAGLHALDSLSDQELKKVIESLEKLKPGRRSKTF